METLENQWNVGIFRKNDVLRWYEKENGLKFPKNEILRVWKPRLVFWSHTTSLSPTTVDQRGHISVFPTGCPRHRMCDQKDMFFLSKMNRNVVPNRNLVKFLFGQSLTIIVDRDLILKIENLPLIFHPGAFAELGIKKALSRG